MNKQDKIIDALNRIDELASVTTQDNDNGEAEEQAKDYDLVFDYIKSTFKPENEHKYCPRCIEDYKIQGRTQKGTKVPSDCKECGVCKDCEHMLECSKNNKAELCYCSDTELSVPHYTDDHE